MIAQLTRGVAAALLVVLPCTGLGQQMIGPIHFPSLLIAFGDLNNDGIQDLFFQQPGQFGVPPPPMFASGVCDTVTGTVLYLTNTNFLVSPAGDVDGDGLADLFVDDPLIFGVRHLRLTNSGQFIWSFPSSQQPIPLDEDLDGDGLNDIYWMNFPPNAPATQVEFRRGISGNLIHAFVPPIPPGASSLSSVLCRSLFSDIDGDGINEIVISDALDNFFFSPPRRIFVISGATGTLIYSLMGTQSGGLFGRVFSVLDDINGDGINDLCLPEPGIYTGSPLNTAAGYGITWVHSGADGSLIYSLPPPAGANLPPWNEFGNGGIVYRPYGVGDQDGDGCGDFALIGTTNVTSLPSNAHELRSGRTGDLIHHVPSFHPLASTHVYNASAVVLGDFDGDGRTDIGTGIPFTGPYILSYRSPDFLDFGVANTTPNGLVMGSGMTGSTEAGQTLRFKTSLPSAEAGTYAHLLFGFSSTQWGPVILPRELSSVGAPGLHLLVSPDIIVTTALHHQGPANTYAELNIVVPPGLPIGLELFGQWVAEAAPASATPFHVSRGFRITF